MDDLIVIIIMLVLTIVGAISQSKKKKNQEIKANSTQGEQKNPDFWETLFEEPQPIENEFSYQDDITVNVDPITITEKKIYTTPGVFDEVTLGEIKSDYLDEIKKGEIGKTEKRNAILDDFSLKKAVVFSEILNHKYF